ncbi:MAG: DHHA1 domain-containing protein [Candidatus Hodarchaeota archaeon]
MNDPSKNLKNLIVDLNKAKDYFFEKIKNLEVAVHIYTHIDADGLAAGAILSKALYRANIPFQITVLRQLEKEEIIKIVKKGFNNFIIFSDFGSGQYLELQEKLTNKDNSASFLILDHHFPQNINNKEEFDLIKKIHQKTSPWHINPYFHGIDGSTEVSGAGICYYFVKSLNERNLDLSPIAIVGAMGDIQNQGPNKSFTGINSLIVDEAKRNGYIEIVDDLNFSSMKPLNEAIAYSSEIKLPGLTNDINKTLKFLQTLGILMENSKGDIRTLNDLNKDEKQKISTGIIEYASLKLDVEPIEIIKKLIVNRYLIKREKAYSELFDSNEFSYVLNACGRTNNASLGIAIAMGDRKKAYQQSYDIILNYKSSIVKSLSWIKENNKIHQMDFIQYFFGEDIIPENIIGTITSMLILERSDFIDIMKPIFGIAIREDENVYKISGRAHEQIVNRGVNLSEAIREALELINLDSLGGGHPPAAGTKVPMDKIELFLEKSNEIIKNQLKTKKNL